ncbi:MAG: NAD-dependent epimerase/dehydratase family protein [Clostridia bacterium]|nr:NAD-dependent epimerase/dehydratase family protein [Clostridia bacterium]
MKVFMVGGTGLLGCAAARLFIEKGYAVKSVALPPLPDGAPIPAEMELIFGNYSEMSDEQLLSVMDGCDTFVFAAGVDERVEFPPPVYEAYRKYNIEPVRRFLTLAKQCGIKNNVILGSYFSYFDKTFPDMHLSELHPYIRSRVEQERIALGFADEETNVCVLELPYVFGTQPGRKPVWTGLAEQLYNMDKTAHFTMCPGGGAAMVTVRQAAQSIVGAAERSKGGKTYPIGYYNLTWDDLLPIVHRAMGTPDRKIVHIPRWMFRLYGKKLQKVYAARGIEPGIDAAELADIMFADMFIDKKWALSLGATDDDIEAAIFESVRLSVDAVSGEKTLLEMKSE